MKNSDFNKHFFKCGVIKISTHYNAQLGLLDKACANKMFVVSWVKPDLISLGYRATRSVKMTNCIRFLDLKGYHKDVRGEKAMRRLPPIPKTF